VRKRLFALGASLFVTVSVAFAATGGEAARRPSLAQAVDRTIHVASLRYALGVQITRDGRSRAMHVRGQADAHTISVAVALSPIRLPAGTKLPGPTGAALLYGPFLYVRAPSNVLVFGKIRWLRTPLAQLSPASDDLRTLHALVPEPLLRVLLRGSAKAGRPGAAVVRGTLAYDDAVVRTSLLQLTGGLEFRALRFEAEVGRDGLVHRLRFTGRTADGRTTLSLVAHLFAFGKPLHVAPPAPGTFMDQELELLAT
jgi:hypothetical protein